MYYFNNSIFWSMLDDPVKVAYWVHLPYPSQWSGILSFAVFWLEFSFSLMEAIQEQKWLYLFV